MPTQSIVLTDRHQELVGELVASGRYRDVSEVLREGLRLLEERIETRRAEIDAIRSNLVESLDQEAKGDFAEGTAEEVVRRAFARKDLGQPA
jgi:antitoxin ParD1/3/4